MKKYANFYFAGMVLLLLQACISTPETPRETVAVAEIGYQETLETATRWVKEGRVDAEEKARLTKAFDAYERSRNAARAAITAHDTIQAGGSIADLDVAQIGQLLGISQEQLEAAQAAGQLAQLLAGNARSNADAVSIALINLRNILAEVE